jgi:hypothetical protein
LCFDITYWISNGSNIHVSQPYLTYLAAPFAAVPLSCCAVSPKHLASAVVEQAPEAFAVPLCAAIRIMCAVACSRASQLAAATAAAAGLGELSLLPVELTGALPPEALLAAVNTLAMVALGVLSASQIAKAEAASAGSSSSKQQQYAACMPLAGSARACAIHGLADADSAEVRHCAAWCMSCAGIGCG